jgi:predicted CoA-binding protein
MVNRQTIDGFYSQKRIAIIGVSRDKKEYSRHLFTALKKQGYEPVAINPNTDNIDGEKCYASIQDVKNVDRAIMLLPPEKTEKAVMDCTKAGIKTLWLHQHVAQGITNTRAIYLCEQNGINLITGFCPFMFVPNTGFPHTAHAFVMKMLKIYPN